MWPRRCSLGRVRACATGSCSMFALVGPFHRKWRYETSPVGLPLELEVTWPEVPLGCSLGRPKFVFFCEGYTPRSSTEKCYRYIPSTFRDITESNFNDSPDIEKKINNKLSFSFYITQHAYHWFCMIYRNIVVYLIVFHFLWIDGVMFWSASCHAMCICSLCPCYSVHKLKANMKM